MKTGEFARFAMFIKHGNFLQKTVITKQGFRQLVKSVLIKKVKQNMLKKNGIVLMTEVLIFVTSTLLQLQGIVFRVGVEVTIFLGCYIYDNSRNKVYPPEGHFLYNYIDSVFFLFAKVRF